MPLSPDKHNRGPAAAAGNRQAILDAARRLFAVRGYHVPLNAIAQEAGVGQGVLYRHFRSRLDLAFEVFEANFVRLEAVAAQPGPETFGRLWDELVELTLQESAFLEMFVDARRSHADYDGTERLIELIEPPLAAARDAGLVAADLTAYDVTLMQRMAYGVMVTALDPDKAREAVRRSIPLLVVMTPERPGVVARDRAEADGTSTLLIDPA